MTVLSKIISPRLTKALKPSKVCLINDCKNVSASLSHKKNSVIPGLHDSKISEF